MARKMWRTLVKKLDSLTVTNGVNAWETAQIITELWNMEVFKEEICGNEQAEAKLQEYAGRFALDIQDMKEMFRRFPDRKDWESGRLDVLRDDTARLLLAETAAARKKNGKPRFGSISRREYEKLKEELASAKNKIRQLQKRVRELEKENKMLKSGKVAV